MKLKTTKTKQEIIYLKKAAKLTIQAFQQIKKQLKNNKFKTEKDIKLFLQKFARENNTKLSFPCIIAAGKNTNNPHHKTSNEKLSQGFLMIDFGISYKNYCSDMTRMFCLGKPTKKEKQLYSLLLKTQKQAIKSLKPNKKTKELEKQARKSLGKYSRYFIHSLGHGIGKKIHERPSFKLKSKDIIKKNQVLTIEPGLYFKNYGLRIEDTILMKRKPVILTKTSKKLISIKTPQSL